MSPPLSLRIIIGSCLFALGEVIATVAYTPIALASITLNYRTRYLIITQWSRFIIWWLKITCGVHWVVNGLEHIPSEPTVVLVKHQSAWETLALQTLFIPQVWVLKRKLLRIPFFGWGLAALRPIAIDREQRHSAMEQMLTQGSARLAAGCWVVIFPEGTRVPVGQRRRYKPGGARLATKTGKPVLPIAHDSGKCWPRNSFLKYPGTIHIVIGQLIATTDRDPNDINAEAEAWIESTVGQLEKHQRDGGLGEGT